VTKLRRDKLILTALHLFLMWGLWLALRGQFAENQNYDYFCCYEVSARNLLSGKGFIYNNGRFADSYPAGYPLFLSLVFTIGRFLGEDPTHKLFVSAAGVATVLLVYSAVRQLGSRAWAMTAGAAAASYPFYLWLSKQPNSETLFIPPLAGAFYCFTRIFTSPKPQAWAAACGFALGAACMVRSIGVFF
jgi:hypothetical protein